MDLISGHTVVDVEADSKDDQLSLNGANGIIVQHAPIMADPLQVVNQTEGVPDDPWQSGKGFPFFTVDPYLSLQSRI